MRFMALGNSTLQAAKQAAPFGLIGSALGLALGLGVEALGPGGSSAKDYAKMGGLGAVVVGSIFQVGGMFYTNKELGGDGLLFTPVTATVGFVGGVSHTRFVQHQTDMKNILSKGLVFGLSGAAIGAAIDIIRSRIN